MHILVAELTIALELKKNYPYNYFTKIYFTSLPSHPDKFRYICQVEEELILIYKYAFNHFN